MISKERMREILTARGLDVAKLASDPRARAKAISLAYKAIPIPWRWFVGQKRLAALIETLANSASHGDRMPASISPDIAKEGKPR
jgi:hypothetical protein